MEAIRKPTQAALAAALGIDPALVTRYKRQGMPVSSVSEALRWRDANVRVRVGKSTDFEVVTAAVRGEDAASAASTMLQAAGELLKSGGDVAGMVTSLRTAMASVPPSMRARVVAPFNVLDVLTAEVGRVMDQGDPEGRIRGTLYQVKSPKGEEVDMGAFWYGVAAGEVRLKPV
ncbi:hypothetical protein [Hydrogenophaga sp.]|uniref:hypothetical protein n=1 Tax=Hydrogenophaga sp. TaxID=1904254 RepID=UPI003BAF295D